MRHLGRLLLLALTALVLAGCGRKDARLEVSGTVTFQGQPLKKGSIQFEPQDGGTAISGDVILDGKYRMSKGKGLTPGKYLVRIYASTEAGLPPAEGEEAPKETSGKKLTVDPIPTKYNDASTLTVEVTQDGSNVFAFEL